VAVTASMVTVCCCKQRGLVCAEGDVLFEGPCVFLAVGGGRWCVLSLGVLFQVPVVASRGLLVQVLHGTAIICHGFHL
jgi:hypothetical protein